MSKLSYPQRPQEEIEKKREFEFKAPSIPKIVAEVKELTQELFMHPAEKPLFNASIYRG